MTLRQRPILSFPTPSDIAASLAHSISPFEPHSSFEQNHYRMREADEDDDVPVTVHNEDAEEEAEDDDCF